MKVRVRSSDDEPVIVQDMIIGTIGWCKFGLGDRALVYCAEGGPVDLVDPHRDMSQHLGRDVEILPAGTEIILTVE